MDFVKIKNLFESSFGLLIEVGFILIIVGILLFIPRQILSRIYRKTDKAEFKLLHNDFRIKIMKPLQVMIGLIGITYIFCVFVARMGIKHDFHTVLRQLRTVIVISCITWLCLEIKSQMMHFWKHKAVYSGRSWDPTRANLASKLITITLIVISGLIILDSLGVQLGALLALGGIGGVTLGLAAKDIFSNFFIGIMLHITQPFEIGDWVHSLDEKIEGKVEKIGFYLTRILGVDKRPFYVPNSFFSNQIMVNASRMSNRRIQTRVSIRYEDFEVVEKIVKAIRVAIKNDPEMDQDETQTVDFVEFAPEGLHIDIRVYTKAIEREAWLRAQQGLLLEIGQIVKRYNAEFAAPNCNLHKKHK